MYCSKCGSKLKTDDLFCSNCGANTKVQPTGTLEKFRSIKEWAESNRRSVKEFEKGKSTERHNPEKLAHMALSAAFGKKLRDAWGDKWAEKADDIEDKNSVLRTLREQYESHNITDDELQEIFSSREFQNYILIDDIVLAVREHAKDWEDSSFLQRIINYRDRAAKTSSDFVGRHQEVLEIKQLLDAPFTDTERKSAIDLDIKERNKVLERLQDFEVYFASDLFVRHDGEKLVKASEAIRDIIDEGFNLCVLQNDRELDQRCFKILSEVEALIKDKLSKAAAQGKLTAEQIKQHEQLPELVSIKGFFNWLDLGTPSLTKDGDMQPAWVILATLKQPQKQIGIHNASNYLSQLLATVPLNGLNKVVDRYKTLKERLLRNDKLTKEEGRKIDALIEEGLIQNKKIHEQYPDRP